jgi:hypothetical protein
MMAPPFSILSRYKPAIGTSGLLLEKYDDTNYGYLRITADKEQLRIAYHQGTGNLLQSRYDLVTVDLKSHTMVANERANPSRCPAGRQCSGTSPRRWPEFSSDLHQ